MESPNADFVWVRSLLVGGTSAPRSSSSARRSWARPQVVLTMCRLTDRGRARCRLRLRTNASGVRARARPGPGRAHVVETGQVSPSAVLLGQRFGLDLEIDSIPRLAAG